MLLFIFKLYTNNKMYSKFVILNTNIITEEFFFFYCILIRAQDEMVTYFTKRNQQVGAIYIYFLKSYNYMTQQYQYFSLAQRLPALLIIYDIRKLLTKTAKLHFVNN